MANAWRPTDLHTEYLQIERVLAFHNIKHLYHFTSIENITNIFRFNCVLSKQELRSRGVFDKVEPGGNALSQQIDDLKGNDRYISLSYRPKLPMAYHVEARRHICYLVLSPSVALGAQVLFTDVNAAASSVQKLDGMAGIRLVNFGAVKKDFTSRETLEFRQKQAEILVPGLIPAAAIEYVAFRSQASLQEALRLCKGLHSPQFRLEEKLFNFGSKNLFGCYQTVLLDKQPSPDNTNIQLLLQNPPDKLVFQRFWPAGVSILTRVHAMPGLFMEFEWKNQSGFTTTSTPIAFEGANDYWVWDTLPSQSLSPGLWYVCCHMYNLEVRVRQFTIPFKIN